MARRIYVEDWSAEFGSPYQISREDHPDENIAVLEEDGDKMQLRTPEAPAASLGDLAFVDGVRSGEAWLYQEDPDTGLGFRGLAGAFGA